MEGSTESMFEIGDKVVYGVVGVCEVENIDTPPIKGLSLIHILLIQSLRWNIRSAAIK